MAKKFDVTIITPTGGRQSGMMHLYSCLCDQDFKGNVQWIVASNCPVDGELTLPAGDWLTVET